MDPAAFANFLQATGPYGLVAVLAGVVVKLWGDLQKAQDGRLSDTKESMLAVAAAVKSIDTALQALGRK